MSHIVVVGSLNMDLVFRAERMPRAGETVTGRDFHTIPGGKGANQAAAIARLGGQVAMVGRVGADAFGVALREGLGGQGVDVTHVIRDGAAPTGVAAILVDSDGESRIIVAPGANGNVGPDDLAAAWTLIQNAALLVLQLEVPIATVEMALDMAQAAGVPALVNAAPGLPVPGGFLCKVQYLVVNESEAGLLAGCRVNDPATAGQAVAALRKLGAHTVIVTLGSQGAFAAGAGLRDGPASSSGRDADEGPQIHVPARRVQVVDATAAGDAFIGGLAVSLVAGSLLPDALRTAVAAGTLAVTRLGAQTSLPALAEVDAFRRNGTPAS